MDHYGIRQVHVLEGIEIANQSACTKYASSNQKFVVCAPGIDFPFFECRIANAQSDDGSEKYDFKNWNMTNVFNTGVHPCKAQGGDEHEFDTGR